MKILGKLARFIEMSMKNTQAEVTIKEEETEDFGVNLGIRQGDRLSTTLFILAMDAVIQNYHIKRTLCWTETEETYIK